MKAKSLGSRLRYLMIGLGIAWLASGCGVNPPSVTPPAGEVVVTQSGGLTLPVGCSPRQVAGLMMRFLDAFNRGDQAQLATFFGADFKWYSVTDFSQDAHHHFVTYNRDDLMPYFARRHAQHEHLRLLQVGVAHGEDSTGQSFVNIRYMLMQTADDIGPGWSGPEQLAIGKGAIDCQAQTISAWSMGMNMAPAGEPPPEYRVCPTPTSPVLTTTAIACTSGQ